MARVTSKLQVTIPKSVADAFGIRPGAEIEFEPAGDVIRVHVAPRKAAASDEDDVADRLASFDRATTRQAERNRWFREHHPDLIDAAETEGRGWRREDLYDRGLAR